MVLDCIRIQQQLKMAKSVLWIIFTVAALPLLFFLPKLVPYYLHQMNSPSPLQGSSARLKHLQQLTQFPVLGQFFQEQKVMQLVVQLKYEEAIRSSVEATLSPINERSFSIWYHKAFSECQLKKLKDCEESLRKASLYSNEYTEDYVQNIYELLQLYSNQKKEKPKPKPQTTLLEEHQIIAQEIDYKQTHDLQQL